MRSSGVRPSAQASVASFRVLVALALVVAVSDTIAAQQSLRVDTIALPSREMASRSLKPNTTPKVSIGGLLEDPDEEFDHRNGLLGGTVRRNGSIVVIDGSRVHTFDRDGKSIGRVGQRGAGPNEFVALSAICVTRGDTLVAYDIGTRRATVLSGDGRIIRQFALTEFLPMDGGACSDDGSILLHRSPSGRDGVSEASVVRVSLFGSIVATYQRLPVRAPPLRVRIVATGQGFIVADPTDPLLRVYGSDGSLRRVVRLTDRRKVMSADELEYIGSAPRRGSSRSTMNRAAADTAVYWPLFDRVVVDAHDRVWLQDFQRDLDTDDRWTVLSIDGELMARVQFVRTPGFHPMTILISAGLDEVVLLQRDGDGAAWFTRRGLLRR